MKTMYLLRVVARWEEDSIKCELYESLEKAQDRMRELHDKYVEEYPKAKNSLLPRRAHIWTDTDIYCDDDGAIVDIYINSLEVH